MFIYTRHAKEKLKIKDNKILKINKRRVENTIRKGQIIEDEEEVISVIGILDRNHSLYVVYRREASDIIIITFFAVKKGRYERKILH